MAASDASATANRASIAAVIVVMIVVALVVGMTNSDKQQGSTQGGGLALDGDGSAGSGQGSSPAAPPSAAVPPSDGGTEPEQSAGDTGAAQGSTSQYGAQPSTASMGGTAGGASADPIGNLLSPAGPQQPSGSATPPPSSNPGGGLVPGEGPEVPNSPDAGNKDAARKKAAGGATIVSKKRIDDQTLDLKIYSPALGHQTGVRLLLPQGWENKSAWPTLYMLPGYHHDYSYSMTDYADWPYFTDFEQFMADKDVLAVLPSDGGSGFFTNWWNHGKHGDPAWETYHTQELPALLESTFRASDNRAIAGLSLAGYGAVEYAVDHPEMYNGVASYSGVLSTTSPGIPTIFRKMWESAGVDGERIWGDRIAQRKIWAANDPVRKAPRLCGEDVNVFLSAGSGIPGRHDPGALQNAQDLLSALGNDPMSYVNSYGQASLLEAGAAVTTRQFENRLRTACGVSAATSLATGQGGGVGITTDYTTKGTHRWEYWEDAFHESWPMLAKSLGVAS